jgi:hypothetical protein
MLLATARRLGFLKHKTQRPIPIRTTSYQAIIITLAKQQLSTKSPNIAQHLGINVPTTFPAHTQRLIAYLALSHFCPRRVNPRRFSYRVVSLAQRRRGWRGGGVVVRCWMVVLE